MWTYQQHDGSLLKDGSKVATGYSGLGLHKNDPHSEDVKNLGPLPKGRYQIGAPYDSPNVGPFALPLEALPGVETFGRGDFRIHGDSNIHPGAASHGCIIVSRVVRGQIASSGDTLLEVVY
jgi:hypothetical protein